MSDQALRAADIGPERRGQARTRRLSTAERELYVWILRKFAAASPPSAEATRAAAEALGLDLVPTGALASGSPVPLLGSG